MISLKNDEVDITLSIPIEFIINQIEWMASIHPDILLNRFKKKDEILYNTNDKKITLTIPSSYKLIEGDILVYENNLIWYVNKNKTLLLKKINKESTLIQLIKNIDKTKTHESITDFIEIIIKTFLWKKH